MIVGEMILLLLLLLVGLEMLLGEQATVGCGGVSFPSGFLYIATARLFSVSSLALFSLARWMSYFVLGDGGAKQQATVAAVADGQRGGNGRWNSDGHEATRERESERARGASLAVCVCVCV